MEEPNPMGIWPTRTACVVSSIYVCFVVCCFAIPGSIRFGCSLAFAYTFSMLQMVEVTTFMRIQSLQSTAFACISLLTACVIPSIQILMVMYPDGYTRHTDDTYGYIYGVKELVVYVLIRRRTKTRLFQKTHVTAVCVWIFILIFYHLCFVRVVEDMAYTIPLDQIGCLIKFSPVFMVSYTVIQLTEHQLFSKSEIPTFV